VAVPVPSVLVHEEQQETPRPGSSIATKLRLRSTERSSVSKACWRDARPGRTGRSARPDRQPSEPDESAPEQPRRNCPSPGTRRRPVRLPRHTRQPLHRPRQRQGTRTPAVPAPSSQRCSRFPETRSSKQERRRSPCAKRARTPAPVSRLWCPRRWCLPIVELSRGTFSGGLPGRAPPRRAQALPLPTIGRLPPGAASMLPVDVVCADRAARIKACPSETAPPIRARPHLARRSPSKRDLSSFRRVLGQARWRGS
jgi:hypothetical protein